MCIIPNTTPNPLRRAIESCTKSMRGTGEDKWPPLADLVANPPSINQMQSRIPGCFHPPARNMQTPRGEAGSRRGPEPPRKAAEMKS